MFTKVLVAAAALAAAVVATAPAEAKSHVSIGIGFGGGFYDDGYYGGGYGDHYGYEDGYYPVYGGEYDGISCWKAKKIVQSHGFYNVYATDCGGKYMRFKAKRYGDWYRVKVDRWGHIVNVDNI